MTQFVVLPLAQVQAEFPRNPQTGSRMKTTSRGHAIDPIALQSGVEFILPMEVLSDPKHAEAITGLGVDIRNPALRREVLPSEFRVETETTEPGGEVLGAGR